MTGKRAITYLLAALTGLLASLFTLRMGTALAAVKRPFLFPPGWVLPLGWAAALLLAAAAHNRMGETGADEGTSAAQRSAAFYLSLVLALAWPVIFFRLDAPLAAAITGLLLTGVWLHTRRMAGAHSEQAGKLMLPCCVWAGYLAYLNVGICILN